MWTHDSNHNRQRWGDNQRNRRTMQAPAQFRDSHEALGRALEMLDNIAKGFSYDSADYLAMVDMMRHTHATEQLIRDLTA
jgi:hypothetical protein